jgi:hypothetical protein
MYPATIIPMVERKSNPSIITLGTGGVNVVCSFGEFVSLNVLCSVLFALEVADSDVVSILIL